MPPSVPRLQRHTDDDPVDSAGIRPVDLGARIRTLRNEHGWTLDQASDRAGISRSSLFKIEKSKMSPTFEVMLKIARGFGVDVSALLTPPEKTLGAGRRSVTRASEGNEYDTPHYRHMLLGADFAYKSFTPFRSVLRARSLDEFDDWDRHDSEDFLYVLSGEMVLYTEFYEPLRLSSGDSIYYDSRMGHACVSVSERDATILWITSDIKRTDDAE